MKSRHVALSPACATVSAVDVIRDAAERQLVRGRTTSSATSNLSPTIIMHILSLAFVSLFALSSHAGVLHPLLDQSSAAWSAVQDGTKVPVVLGVMSGCPDAILCESVFDRVLERVKDKVDLTLTFIGK